MNFGSDNTGPVHPRVMEALARANEGCAPSYGADDLTRMVEAKIRDLFEAPDAAVCLVATGTAANALSLALHSTPWSGIYCSRGAHIHTDECGAPEFYTGGAKLILIDARDGRISADDLHAAIEEGRDRGLHYVQPGPVSITQTTECGTVYGLDDIRHICAVAKAAGLPVHMDGARFTNALVSLDCTPAEMSWKAGVDVLSFGGTKNGLMGVEAVIVFDPSRAQELELRRKRAGHLFSKHRFLAAQMAAYLTDDLWRDMATRANAAAARLARGLRGVPDAAIAHDVDANMIFVSLPRAAHRRAVSAGAQYYVTLDDLAGGGDADPVPARLVCDWSTRDGTIDRFLDLVGDSA